MGWWGGSRCSPGEFLAVDKTCPGEFLSLVVMGVSVQGNFLP